MIFGAAPPRIYIATKPVDFRNYAEPVIMQSERQQSLCCRASDAFHTRAALYAFVSVPSAGSRRIAGMLVVDIMLASRRMRSMDQSAKCRWLDGMCSGIVVCRRLPELRIWAAMRSPLRKTSTVRAVRRTSSWVRRFRSRQRGPRPGMAKSSSSKIG